MFLPVNDFTTNLLQKSLDASWLRQEVIADNLANANTPGFKKSYVVFEDYLKNAVGNQNGIQMRRTDPRHIAGSTGSTEPVVLKDPVPSTRVDGNNVDIEEEMTKLVVNSVNYNFAVAQLGRKMGMMETVISEGRK